MHVAALFIMIELNLAKERKLAIVRFDGTRYSKLQS